jgi:sarcosine oxidase gamma subunit
MKVAQSAAHEVGVILRRLGADKLGGDSFDLYVYRGFALSFWEWLTEAAAETGYRVDPPGSA